jgi:hypothetical protein
MIDGFYFITGMGFSVLVDVGGDGFFFLNSSLISHKGKSGSVSFAKDRYSREQSRDYGRPH